MALSNVDTIYQENPFLSRIIARDRVPDAHVRRWSKEFLSSTPGSYPDSGSEKIYLVDKDGNTVGKVDTWWAFLRNGTNETIGQALARIGNEKAHAIRYAIGVWNGRVTLWKLPSGYESVADWLNQKPGKESRPA